MEIESLRAIVARKIAATMRKWAAYNRNAFWEYINSREELVSSLKIPVGSDQDIFQGLGSLESDIALMIHRELIQSRDEIGYYLSCLLPTLENFSIEVEGFSFAESGFAVLAFEKIPLFLPNSTRELRGQIPYPEEVSDTWLEALSEHPCAPNLTTLELSRTKLTSSSAKVLRKFTSLLTLHLSRVEMTISQYCAILLELPQLVDINFYCQRGGSEVDIFSTLFGIGEAPTFPLPNIEKLYTSHKPHTAEYEAIISNLEKFPTAANIRGLPLPTDVSDPFVANTLKRALKLMPLEEIGGVLAWSFVSDILPIASSLQDLTLDSALIAGTDVDESSDPSMTLILDQSAVEELARRLPELRSLSLWCTSTESLSLEALSVLTTLQIDPSSIPKAARVKKPSFVLPQSLEKLSISFDQAVDATDLVTLCTPLVNLTELVVTTASFTLVQLDAFVAALPKQIARLELSHCLRGPPKAQRNAEKHTIKISLPKLVDFDATDGQFFKRKISFKFVVAPRLRSLRGRTTAEGAQDMLSSLAAFPECLPMLRMLEIQIPYPYEPEDEVIQLLLGFEIPSYRDIATLVLDPVVRPEELLSISQSCNLISALSLSGFTLSDSISKSVLEALPLLTYLSFYNTAGLRGLSWLRHHRLKRADVMENTLELIGEFLPALQEFSIWSKTTSPQDFRPRSVIGLPALRRADLRACQTVVVRDLPHLRELSADFDADDGCSLEISGSQHIVDLDLSFGKLQALKLNLDAPEVTKISMSFATEAAAITNIVMDLVKQCPKIKRVSISAEAAVFDVDLLWVASSTLHSVDLNDASFERPQN